MNLRELLSQKKAILWDFDGCFCDSEEVHLEAYSKAFAHYGHCINKNEYFHTFTHLGGGIALEIKNHQLKNCPEEEIKRLKSKYYLELIHAKKAKLFKEIPSITLKAYALGLKNIIASNSPKEEIEIIIGQNKETLSLDGIVGLTPGLKKKPAPDIFLKAMKDFSLEPEQCLVIEDSERGLIAAKAADCQALWIKTTISDLFSTKAPYLEKISHINLLSALENALPPGD